MTKILMVEDDANLGSSIREYLVREGYDVEWAKSLESVRALTPADYEIILLDWMLPDGQGIDYLKEVRSENVKVPIIMLTARNDTIDKVIGLEGGANDYMTKPFEPRELIARIRVQIRDKVDDSAEELSIISVGDVEINAIERKAFFQKTEVELTKMEFDFLTLLASHPNRAFSREEILNKVWGYENYPTTRTVDTHVLQLRQKFFDGLIETVRGIGYRLKN